MVENGFEPQVSSGVAQQLSQLEHQPPSIASGPDVRDLRGLLWSSIDNDTSRDLDQLEVAERLPDGATKVMVAIADVDAFVAKDSPIDQHAARQTVSVYTGVQFPDVAGAVVDRRDVAAGRGRQARGRCRVRRGADGRVLSSAVYRAVVRNAAQLTYNAVGAWLEGRGAAPPKVAASPDLQSQLRLQNSAAQALRTERYRHGALNIETIETPAGARAGRGRRACPPTRRTSATELIEDFMIASNEVVARLLEARGVSSIRRVVRAPKRWDRIVALAATLGGHLPATPDSKALNEFLIAAQGRRSRPFCGPVAGGHQADGSGRVRARTAGRSAEGHFGLAVEDYTHSTAPNRRFADLVTQRLVKAVLANQPPPYGDDELAAVAANCTAKEDAARKVERAMSKRIAAAAMSGRIGESFDAIVTGVTPSGTFVRVLKPHVEGLLAQGHQGIDVGDKLRVRLTRTDAARGFVDFARE